MALTRFADMRLVDCPDCISLSESGKCLCLNVVQCQGESCPFKHTKEDEVAATRKIEERLAIFDQKTQQHISRKYYKVKYLWREDGMDADH